MLTMLMMMMTMVVITTAATVHTPMDLTDTDFDSANGHGQYHDHYYEDYEDHRRLLLPPIEHPPDRKLQSSSPLTVAVAFECNDNNVQIYTTTAKPVGYEIRVCITPNIASQNLGVVIQEVASFAFFREGENARQPVIQNGVEIDENTLLLCIPGSLTCAFKTKLTQSLFYGNSMNSTVFGSGQVNLEYAAGALGGGGVFSGFAGSSGVTMHFLVDNMGVPMAANPTPATTGDPSAQQNSWWLASAVWIRVMIILAAIIVLFIVCGVSCCFCFMVRNSIVDEWDRKRRDDEARRKEEEAEGYYTKDRYRDNYDDEPSLSNFASSRHEDDDVYVAPGVRVRVDHSGPGSDYSANHTSRSDLELQTPMPHGSPRKGPRQQARDSAVNPIWNDYSASEFSSNGLDDSISSAGQQSMNSKTVSSVDPTAPPTDFDVCFDADDHPGTIVFDKAVRKTVAQNSDKEYSPSLYRAIKKQLPGRRFFVCDDEDNPEVWREVTKKELVEIVGSRFDEIKKTYQKRTSTRAGDTSLPRGSDRSGRRSTKRESRRDDTDHTPESTNDVD